MCSKWPLSSTLTQQCLPLEQDHLWKNAALWDPGGQALVLQACLEQFITEKEGQLWQREGNHRAAQVSHNPHAQVSTALTRTIPVPSGPSPQQDGPRVISRSVRSSSPTLQQPQGQTGATPLKQERQKEEKRSQPYSASSDLQCSGAPPTRLC